MMTEQNAPPYVSLIRFCILLTFLQLVFVVPTAVIARNRLFYTASLNKDDPSQSCILHAELIYPVNTSKRGDEYTFRCIDLNSGRVRDVGTFRARWINSVMSSDSRVWTICESSVIEFDGTTMTVHFAKRLFSQSGNLLNDFFIYEGRPAEIQRNADGLAHLCVFEDQKWIDRGEIALPDAGQSWSVDDNTGEAFPDEQPQINAAINQKTATGAFVHVVPVDGTYQVFQTEPIRPLIAQRTGFEFVASQSDDHVASAVFPDNVEHRATGWRLVDSKTLPEKSPWDWILTSASANGTIYFAIDNVVYRFRAADRDSLSPKLEKLRFDRDITPVFPDFGQNNSQFPPRWIRPSGQIIWGRVSVISDHETDQVIIATASQSGETDFYRMDGDQLVKLPFRTKGSGWKWINSISRLLLLIIVALWIGAVLMILQADWIAKAKMLASHEFGHDSVRLASIRRRTVARVIDLLLVLGPLVAQIGWILYRTPADTYLFANSLLIIQPQPLLRSLTPPLESSLWAVAMIGVIATTTGLYGVSPGKWLCGIRVVQTTHRHCGIPRALLRELMMWFDTPLLLTPLPAVFCQCVTRARQRLGDLLADTIVIERQSINR